MLSIKKLLTKIVNAQVGHYSVYASANQTLSTQGGNFTCLLNSVSSSAGSLLSFNATSHKVIIGAGVSVVEVSGAGYITTVGTTGPKAFEIHKNTTPVNRVTMSLSSNYNVLTMAPRYVSVAEGDEITLHAISNNGTTTVVGGGETSTFLNVKVIA